MSFGEAVIKATNENMETQASLIESLFEKVEAYVKTSYELSKLRVLEKTTRLAISLVTRLSVIVAISLCILILNIGIALLIGELLGKLYYGFFIVAAFYLVVGIVLYFFLYKWIKKPVSDLIIRQSLQ